MLAQVAVHAILCEVTPQGGEGALGTWRTQKDTPAGHVGPGEQGSTVRSVESYSKLRESGVNVSEHLSVWHVGKAVRGQAMTANRTRENRLSGMIGGLAETWTRVKAIRAHNAETPKQTSLHLRLRALHFYPDRRRGACESKYSVY